MIDPAEKSTEVPPLADQGSGQAEVAPGVFLDSRLGLYHQHERWLAISDVHFGYEMSRRAAGGVTSNKGWEGAFGHHHGRDGGQLAIVTQQNHRLVILT